MQQFGLATIPSCSSARAPFTSGTTSGTPSASRYAADLSTTTAPPRTACGTSSREPDVPIEKRHEVEVAGGERLRRRLLDDERLAAEGDARAGRPRRRERAHVVVAALGEQLERDRADGAGRADDADLSRSGAAKPRPPPGGSVELRR